VAPPGDVRLAYQPNSGLQDYVELFEAAGRAICWSSIDKSRSWESRNLGPRLGPRALGYLLGLVWLEPRWWQVFGALRGEEERPGISGPTPEQIDDLLRTQLLASLLRLRVEGLVLPAVRAELQGAPSRVTEAVWGRQGAATAARDQFALLMRAWVGIDLTREQRLGYVDHLNPLLEPFDLRAYALAHQLQEQLRREQGEAWFERPAVGRRLLQGLCGPGSGSTDRQLVRRVGLRELDLDAPWRNLAVRWKALHRGGE
jgi:hypothetical protein